jgi:hypothetical protein
MQNALSLFSQITTHLVSLTTFNEIGIGNNSRDIGNYDELADELNDMNIKSLRNTDWTGNSLKCFLYRCRKNYSKDVLADQCPLEMIGVRHDEYLMARILPKKQAGKIKCKIRRKVAK